MGRFVLDSTSRYHSLRISEFSLQVRLGCSQEERARAQEVRVSVEFRFVSPPQGINSDRLEDTICYARVCQSIRNLTDGREFALLEKLASDLMSILQEFSKGIALVALTVHKVLPPVEGLRGGTVYRIGDFV